MDKTRTLAHIAPSARRSELFDNPMIAEKFLTSDELAEALNVSVHAIRKWRMQGKIPYLKFGRSLRFRASDVITALKGNEND